MTDRPIELRQAAEQAIAALTALASLAQGAIENISDQEQGVIDHGRTALASLEEALSSPAAQTSADTARMDWLEQNIFHREMDDWDAGMRPNSSMWVLFAPSGHQGSARRIIDAAMGASAPPAAAKAATRQPDERTLQLAEQQFGVTFEREAAPAAATVPDLRNENPIGLTPPQKDLQSRQFAEAAAATVEVPADMPRKHIDANELERMAKAHPNERFLKGSGVLKLTGAIRQLEGELRAARAALSTPTAQKAEPEPWWKDPRNFGAAEFARPTPAPQWQPIETAPKDGAKLLLWLPWVSEATVGYWTANGNRSRMGAGWTCRFTGFSSRVAGEPTHWMPLPPQPGAVTDAVLAASGAPAGAPTQSSIQRDHAEIAETFRTAPLYSAACAECRRGEVVNGKCDRCGAPTKGEQQ